jgi:hypothetical protein
MDSDFLVYGKWLDSCVFHARVSKADFALLFEFSLGIQNIVSESFDNPRLSRSLGPFSLQNIYFSHYHQGKGQPRYIGTNPR